LWEAALRFFILVAAAAITGAASVVGLPKLFPGYYASTVAAMRSAGAEVAQLRLADLNPLRADYDYVAREIASPSRKLDFPTSAPVVVDQSKMLTPSQLSFGSGFATNNNAQARFHSAPSRR
jgi:hypothetical protein